MRTPQEALQWAKTEQHFPSQNWYGQCLKFVRTCYKIPARDHDAKQAWKRAKHKHADTHPPAGVPVFWTGSKYGHVAVSAGGGWIYSTDIKRRGKVDICRLSLIEEDWGLTYAGWTEDLNGVHFYQPAKRSHNEWYVYDKTKKIVVAYGSAEHTNYTFGYRTIEETK